MLYHTAIAHLFRPMLKIDLINFKLKPRDACIEAANRVSDLFRLYRQHYPMRACQLVLTHILLSSCIVHLLFSKDPKHASTSYRNLVEGLIGLEDLSVCHWFGARAFKIIYETAQAWDLPFPDELKESRLVPTSATSLNRIPSSVKVSQAAPSRASTAPYGMTYSPVPPSANANRKESLSMFARPDRKPVHLPSHSTTPAPPTIPPSEPLQRGSHSRIVPSYPQSTSSATRPVVASQQPSTTGPGETLFWNPLPNMAGMGVPIMPRQPYGVRPMDLDNMLGNVDEWDRLSRDGFKMSDAWPQQDHHAQGYGGAAGHHPESYATTAATAQGGAEHNEYVTHHEATHYPTGGAMGHGSVPQSGGPGFDAGWWGGENNMER